MLKKPIYTLILSVVIAVISVAGYLYSVVYVGGLVADLRDMYRKAGDLNKEEESLKSIKKVAENANQRNAELSKYIVPVKNEGSINFVKTLEETADKYGLKSNTNAIEIVSDDALSKLNKEYLSIKITTIGSEASVTSFVKKLELLPFNVKIKNYSLTRVLGGQGVVVSKNSNSIINQQLDMEILVIKEK